MKNKKDVLIANYATNRQMLAITSGVLARGLGSDEPYSIINKIVVIPSIKYVGGVNHTFEIDSQFFLEDGTPADVKGKVKLTNDYAVMNILLSAFNRSYIKGMEAEGYTLEVLEYKK